MERTFYGKTASFLIKHTSGETHLQFCLRKQPRHSDPILSSPHDTTAHCQVERLSLTCSKPALCSQPFLGSGDSSFSRNRFCEWDRGPLGHRHQLREEELLWSLQQTQLLLPSSTAKLDLTVLKHKEREGWSLRAFLHVAPCAS